MKKGLSIEKMNKKGISNDFLMIIVFSLAIVVFVYFLFTMAFTYNAG